ncbi:MAG: hypothetical protein KDD42_06940 [Bdellovibrionales bacterium]|nr:hypothetical protein [Bdellovibrionales bacterium]
MVGPVNTPAPPLAEVANNEEVTISPETTSVSFESIRPADVMQLKQTPEAQIVQNTIEFQDVLRRAGTDPDKVRAAVVSFLERGGLRGEHNPLSRKDYSTILKVEPDQDGNLPSIVVGKTTAMKDGIQVELPKTRTLDAGLYRFDYNTENGLSLFHLNDPRDVLPLVLSADPANSLQLNVTANQTNLDLVKGLIENTAEWYQAHPNSAILAEVLTNELHTPDPDGNVGWAESASQQNSKALEIISDEIGNILQNVDPATRQQWGDRIYDIVHPDLIRISRGDHSLSAVIRDQLDFRGTPAELRIGLNTRVDGTLVLTASKPTHLDVLNHRESPVLHLQFADLFDRESNFAGPSVGDISRHGLRFRRDFDNKFADSEKSIEQALDKEAGPDNAPRLFSIAVNGASLGSALIDRFRPEGNIPALR